jgi:iron complex transport system substrate-binding protein
MQRYYQPTGLSDMNKKVSLGLILSLAAIVAGCDQKSNQPSQAPVQQQSQSPAPTIPPAPANITIKHANGETTIAKDPQRIVTMDFGTLDTLDKFGLSDKIVGIPKNSVPDYLKQYEADGYTNVGNMKEPDLEVIRGLNPDLIVITGRQGKSFEQLSQIAPTITVGIDAKNYQQSFDNNVETLASLFDKQDLSKQYLADLETKISNYRTKADASELKALVIMHNANKISAANTGAYATIIHDVAGIKRADSDTEPKRQAADDAYLTAINPDIIFIVDRSAAIGQEGFDKALLETDAIKTVNAYKNDKIIYLTPDLWYLSGGGLESLSLQLDEAIQAID